MARHPGTIKTSLDGVPQTCITLVAIRLVFSCGCGASVLDSQVRANTDTPAAWAALWHQFAAALPGGVQLSPMRAASCGDFNQCVGVDKTGACVCKP